MKRKYEKPFFEKMSFDLLEEIMAETGIGGASSIPGIGDTDEEPID